MSKAFKLRENADREARTFPPMLIAATRIADTVIHGLHGRRRSGPGEDFWQFRRYTPGDAAQRIDWRRSAKSSRLFVRENEWAATNTLWTWVCPHERMQFQSDLAMVSKRERAVMIALALSVMAVRAGEQVATLAGPDNPGHTSASLTRIAEFYANPDTSGPALPAHASLPRYATTVLISDFLDPVDEIREKLHHLASSGINGHMLQILDPVEETFPFSGRTEFHEIGGNRKILAGRAEKIRDQYQSRLHAHRAELKLLARSLGWSFSLHHTDRPVHSVLLGLYNLIAGDSPSQQYSKAG